MGKPFVSQRVFCRRPSHFAQRVFHILFRNAQLQSMRCAKWLDLRQNTRCDTNGLHMPGVLYQCGASPPHNCDAIFNRPEGLDLSRCQSLNRPEGLGLSRCQSLNRLYACWLTLGDGRKSNWLMVAQCASLRAYRWLFTFFCEINRHIRLHSYPFFKAAKVNPLSHTQSYRTLSLSYSGS